MANFDADTLRELRDVQEIAIRTEKHPKSAVVIWVVVADGEVFVRSVRGSKGRWYRDLAAGGPATLVFAGRQLARVANDERLEEFWVIEIAARGHHPFAASSSLFAS